MNLLSTSALKAPSIALYIPEFQVIPIGYNLTVVCIENKSKASYLQRGQPYATHAVVF